jgi:hypothetical protein
MLAQGRRFPAQKSLCKGSRRVEEKSMTMKGVFRAALVFVMAAGCSLFTVGARAQGTMHMPLDKATISGDMAKKAAVKDQLSADLAQDIVNECVRIAKASPNGTLSVFVLAPDGEILAAHRMDGQNKINTVTGYKKAQTALWLRIPTLDQGAWSSAPAGSESTS